MSTQRPQHDMVIHPAELLAVERRWVSRLNERALLKLAAVFGLPLTVWVFAAVTIAAKWMSPGVQSEIFFFSSGCIQLFALPLMVYVGNKLQKSSDAQSDAQHQALTHIATVGDDVKQLLELNNTLTAEVHQTLSTQKARERATRPMSPPPPRHDVPQPRTAPDALA